MAAEDYHYIGRPVVAPFHWTRRYQTPLIPFCYTSRFQGATTHPLTDRNASFSPPSRLPFPLTHTQIFPSPLLPELSTFTLHSLKWKFAQLPQSDSFYLPSASRGRWCFTLGLLPSRCGCFSLSVGRSPPFLGSLLILFNCYRRRGTRCHSEVQLFLAPTATPTTTAS